MSLRERILAKTFKPTSNPKYLVSTSGEVYSLKSKKLLKPVLNKVGYLVVNINIDGKRHPTFIHRLVAKAFIKNEQNKPTVNHKNGDKTDNRLENLEWCTHSENITHSFRVLKRQPGMLGKKGKSGITHYAAKPIVLLNSNGLLLRSFSTQYEVDNYFKWPKGRTAGIFLGHKLLPKNIVLKRIKKSDYERLTSI